MKEFKISFLDSRRVGTRDVLSVGRLIGVSIETGDLKKLTQFARNVGFLWIYDFRQKENGDVLFLYSRILYFICPVKFP